MCVCLCAGVCFLSACLCVFVFICVVVCERVFVISFVNVCVRVWSVCVFVRMVVHV